MLDYVDPLTLRQKLEQAAVERDEPLLQAALKRIKELEQLCAMMTDTGVILEEDVQCLVKADTWWLPGDSEYCFTDLKQAMQETALPGDVVEWGRAHTLENSFVVWCEELRDANGRVVVPESVTEYDTYQQAENAAAEYTLRKRRLEYEL